MLNEANFNIYKKMALKSICSWITLDIRIRIPTQNHKGMVSFARGEDFSTLPRSTGYK
jgi:hypothetical protein